MPAEGNRLAGLIVLRAKRPGSIASGLVTLFASGDVMPGCGVDQILPHSGDPELQEDCASDANAYVRPVAGGHARPDQPRVRIPGRVPVRRPPDRATAAGPTRPWLDRIAQPVGRPHPQPSSGLQERALLGPAHRGTRRVNGPGMPVRSPLPPAFTASDASGVRPGCAASRRRRSARPYGTRWHDGRVRFSDWGAPSDRA